MSDRLIKAAGQDVNPLLLESACGCYLLPLQARIREKGPPWVGTALSSTVRKWSSVPTSPRRWMPLCSAQTAQLYMAVLLTEACLCQGLKSPLGGNSSERRRVPGMSGHRSEAGVV